MTTQIEWIPIKVREMTDEEKESYGTEHGLMWDCPVPDYNEEVLITLINGSIDITPFYDDYFEDYEWEDLSAWARLPEPYKEETESEE